MTLGHISSEYFTTKKPLIITAQEEETFQQSKECWLCEQALCDNPLGDTQSARCFASGDKCRDHGHLTGKYRGAAQSKCSINVKQKQSSFNPIFFHNVSGYDCHIIFEELLTQAYEMGYEPKIIPKSMESYVSVQVGCLKFSN